MENNDEQNAQQAIRQAAKSQIRTKADEFYHSYQTIVRVSYAELKKHGALEAWLVLRGQSGVDGEYDWVTIGQAVALGLIKTTLEA